MDENDKRNQNDEIILKEELDINLNDLFTIDFKNLKLFLTTILKNQNKLSQKMNIIESNINDKDKKIDKNFSLLNKKIKTIENNYELNSSKLNNLQKGLEDQIKKEEDDKKELEEKEKTDLDRHKEEPEYLITNSNLEIISNKKSEIASNESLNATQQNIERDKEKTTEGRDEDNINKEMEKEMEKEIKKDFNIKDIKTEMKSKLDQIEKANEKKNKKAKKNNTIPEEESNIKSDFIEEEELKDSLEIKKKPKKEQNLISSDKNIFDPYRNIPTTVFNKYDELLTKFPTLLNEFEQIKTRINFVEKWIKTEDKENRVMTFKIGENNTKNVEDIQYLKLLIKDLQNKNINLDTENKQIKKDIDDIKVKLQDINIFDALKGEKFDQGNIDITKALVMTLEQKVFKKTGLIDEKIKYLEESMNRIENDTKNVKNIAEILKLSNEDIKRVIKNLEELENKNAEDNLNLLNDVHNAINDIKKLKEFETKASESLKNNDSILEKVQSNLTRNNKRLNEIEELLEEYEPQSPGVDKGQFQRMKNELNESIKDLKRKNLDIDKEIEYLKKHPDLLKAKEDIIKLQKEISVKCNKADYLDLKDKFNEQGVELSNLSDSIEKIQTMTNKSRNEIGFLLKRIENLNALQVSTRSALDSLIKKQEELLFDSSKYLEQSTFNKFLISLQKEKEANEANIATINKVLKEMAETIKSKSGSEDMKFFEELINSKLEELKLYALRKLADKTETFRNIRYLDSQIRHIIDVYIKKEHKHESWLIAKKPLGGYSCASCESYLGELKNTKEFTPWSKYPNRDDKNYRYGSGFSRMLNMLNLDFKNQLDSIKDNAYESDNEGRNSAEPKSIHSHRFNKNLSGANIFNSQSNSRNVNTNETNRNDPFPLIRLNKASEKNGNEYMSMDLSDNGTNKINESTNLNNDNLIKDDIIRKSDEPHVSKIYRKNKLKNIEFNKKA